MTLVPEALPCRIEPRPRLSPPASYQIALVLCFRLPIRAGDAESRFRSHVISFRSSGRLRRCQGPCSLRLFFFHLFFEITLDIPRRFVRRNLPLHHGAGPDASSHRAVLQCDRGTRGRGYPAIRNLFLLSFPREFGAYIDAFQTEAIVAVLFRVSEKKRSWVSTRLKKIQRASDYCDAVRF